MPFQVTWPIKALELSVRRVSFFLVKNVSAELNLWLAYIDECWNSIDEPSSHGLVMTKQLHILKWF